MLSTKRFITAAIILAVCGFLLSSVYIIYLLTKPPVFEEPGPDLDYEGFEDRLDQGVGADDYTKREMYTMEQYEVDKKIFMGYFEDERYDLASEHAHWLLAMYQFDNECLYTISTIEKMSIMEKDTNDEWKCTTEERINIYNSLHDIDMYIYFFMKIPMNEQAMLVYRDYVNMLPGFKWESIECEKTVAHKNDPAYDIIGNQEYYNIKLTYKRNCFYIKIRYTTYFDIFCITDEAGTMDGVKYQPAKDPYEDEIFK